MRRTQTHRTGLARREQFMLLTGEPEMERLQAVLGHHNSHDLGMQDRIVLPDDLGHPHGYQAALIAMENRGPKEFSRAVRDIQAREVNGEGHLVLIRTIGSVPVYGLCQPGRMCQHKKWERHQDLLGGRNIISAATRRLSLSATTPEERGKGNSQGREEHERGARTSQEKAQDSGCIYMHTPDEEARMCCTDRSLAL
jgi:hypothetical protein